MKFDKKPLEAEMDLLLGEIPTATSAPPISHHPHHHHAIPIPSSSSHAPISPPFLYGHHHRHHPSPLSDRSTWSSSTSSSFSSPQSPVNDAVNAADLLAVLRSLSLRPSPGGPSPAHLGPYPALYPPRRPSGFYGLAPAPAPARAPPAFYNPDDGSFILEGRGQHREGGPNSNFSKKQPAAAREDDMMKFESLAEVPGYIYQAAKDQSGCRLLQKKFEEGRRHDVDRIFNGIIGHVADLMMNPFGNYLVQRLLEVCDEEQRTRIVFRLTHNPSVILKLCFNTHGTRAVQKLIETLGTQQQIKLVVSALRPGFVNLMKDLNGNHVVQRCLLSLSTEDNKFIFEAAAKYCADIATHRNGCCVMQRCVAYSAGEYQTHLAHEICANGLLLAQDAFGNYVVQYLLDEKIPSVPGHLASVYEGSYVHLSTQKFSSNVVEKCLRFFSDNDKAMIVFELLSVTRFEMLLQDPYANYVIQSALTYTKGPLHTALVNAIRPHAPGLRTSPYCKRIFSRTQLKK